MENIQVIQNEINKKYKYRLSYYFNVHREMNYVSFIDTLKKSIEEDLDSTIILTFQLRDCRGGKGERKLFRWGKKATRTVTTATCSPCFSS